MKLNAEVICKLVQQVAKEAEVFESDNHEARFKEDPELWIVSFFFAAKRRLEEKSSTPIGWICEEANYESNQEEAAKLLKRKRVTAK